MKSKLKPVIVSAAAVLMVISSAQAQSIVYDNLSTSATAGYSEANANNPIFGDALNLTSGGQLTIFGCSLYNSTSGGNAGSITNGTMVVNFYDNTVAYAGGAITGALLGTASLPWDFSGSGGLVAGFYTTDTFDLTSLNITLTQNILVTQQFTETVGNSTRNGVVLFGDPTTGSSPATVFISSSATAAGLYTFSGNPGQFAYQVQVVPEPSTLALAGLGMAALMSFRRLRN
jgi:hypothetical protein